MESFVFFNKIYNTGSLDLYYKYICDIHTLLYFGKRFHFSTESKLIHNSHKLGKVFSWEMLSFVTNEVMIPIFNM